MLSKLVVALVLAWGIGLESWDGVGEPGGIWEGALRSLIWPPWKVLLTVDPLERREEGVEDEEEAPEAPAMLWVEGDAGGRRWDKELGRDKKWLFTIKIVSKCITVQKSQISSTLNFFQEPSSVSFTIYRIFPAKNTREKTRIKT